MHHSVLRDEYRDITLKPRTLSFKSFAFHIIQHQTIAIVDTANIAIIDTVTIAILDTATIAIVDTVTHYPPTLS
jgi:hypothetical protein